MQSQVFELGPGSLRSAAASPFEITWEQWQRIHLFLMNVNGTSPETAAHFVRLMPAYGDLRQAAATWRARTFANLIGIAESIASYNRDVVQVNYPRIDALTTRWQTVPPTAAESAEFDQLIAAGVEQARRNGDAAAPVVHDLQVLMDAVEATTDQSQTALANLLGGAYADGGPMAGDLPDELVSRVEQIAQALSTVAAVLAVVGTPPVADIERVRGGWGAIHDDLGRLKDWLLSETSSAQPFVAQLNVEAALGEWGALAAEAGAFADQARGALVH